MEVMTTKVAIPQATETMAAEMMTPASSEQLCEIRNALLFSLLAVEGKYMKD